MAPAGVRNLQLPFYLTYFPANEYMKTDTGEKKSTLVIFTLVYSRARSRTACSGLLGLWVCEKNLEEDRF
jgi:hypothetical protein